MISEPLPAHSLAEAYLYLMATPCSDCGRGPLRGSDAKGETIADQVRLTIGVRCGSCGRKTEYRFTVPGNLALLQSQQASRSAARVNPTDHPSQIIDVAQWIMLFRMITEAASKENDKTEIRRLGYEAAQCLEEALKFYDEDNDLPPDSTFFHESSRQMRREYPHEFSRERLIDLRGKLPALDAMETSRSIRQKAKRKRWWAPWR